jgi:hypothetical protein
MFDTPEIASGSGPISHFCPKKLNVSFLGKARTFYFDHFRVEKCDISPENASF